MPFKKLGKKTFYNMIGDLAWKQFLSQNLLPRIVLPPFLPLMSPNTSSATHSKTLSLKLIASFSCIIFVTYVCVHKCI